MIADKNIKYWEGTSPLNFNPRKTRENPWLNKFYNDTKFNGEK
jgi:hypothetical protein